MFEVTITGLKAKVTKNELLTTGTVGIYIYDLSDSLSVTVNTVNGTIEPEIEMYRLRSKNVDLPQKYLPQIADWAAGDRGASAYISNRDGGYIEPGDVVIGYIERVSQAWNGNRWSSDAYVWSWLGDAPSNDTAIRIAGMYLDGTIFDQCCLYGSLAYKPNTEEYGTNPFRFKCAANIVQQIERNIVKYATVYTATLHKYSPRILPKVTDETWGLARAQTKIYDTNDFTEIVQTAKGVLYSRRSTIVKDYISNRTELLQSRGLTMQINSDPSGVLSEFLALPNDDLVYPVRIFVRESGYPFEFDVWTVSGDWYYISCYPDFSTKIKKDLWVNDMYPLAITYNSAGYYESVKTASQFGPSDPFILHPAKTRVVLFENGKALAYRRTNSTNAFPGEFCATNYFAGDSSNPTGIVFVHLRSAFDSETQKYRFYRTSHVIPFESE